MTPLSPNYILIRPANFGHFVKRVNLLRKVNSDKINNPQKYTPEFKEEALRLTSKIGVTKAIKMAWCLSVPDLRLATENAWIRHQLAEQSATQLKHEAVIYGEFVLRR